MLYISHLRIENGARIVQFAIGAALGNRAADDVDAQLFGHIGQALRRIAAGHRFGVLLEECGAVRRVEALGQRDEARLEVGQKTAGCCGCGFGCWWWFLCDGFADLFDGALDVVGFVGAHAQLDGSEAENGWFSGRRRHVDG